MIANYHTHTARCRHAIGTDEEYVQEAIAKGLKTLGFSDHTPYYYPDKIHFLDDRMHPRTLEDYFASLLRLKEKYKDVIDIKIGLETEYYPELWELLLEEYRKYPLEYLILGQHRTGNVHLPPSHSVFSPTSSEAELTKYVDQSIAAMELGVFSYIAHPDVFFFKGADGVYVSEMSRLIKRAVELDLPLEFNLNGLRQNIWYPNDLFWREAARLGAVAVIGCDAHSPKTIGVPEEEASARKTLGALGIKILDEVKLIKPIF